MNRIVLALFLFLFSTFTLAKVVRVGSLGQDIVVSQTLSKLEKDMNVEFKIVSFQSNEEAVSALENKEIDLISNIHAIDKLTERFRFSLPYSFDYSYVYTKIPIDSVNVSELWIEQDSVYASLLKLRNSSSRIIMKTYDRTLGFVTSFHYPDNAVVLGSMEHLEKLLSQGYYADRTVNSWFVPPVAFAGLKEGEGRLISDINLAIQNGSYLSQSSSIIEMQERQARISGLRKSVLAHNIVSPITIRYKAEDLETDGLIEDSSASKTAINEACTLLGFQCQFDNEVDESWQSVYDSLLNEEIDMISGMAVNDSRSRLFSFSEIYYYPEMYLVGNLDQSGRNIILSELTSERIGVVKGDFFEQLFNKFLTSKKLYLYESQEALIQALVAGEIDFLPIGSINYNKLMYETGYKLPIDIVNRFKLPIDYGVAIAFQNNEQGQVYAKLFSEAMQIVDFPEVISKFSDRKDWRASMIKMNKFIEFAISMIVITGLLMLSVIVALYHEATTDQLTNLGNRRALYRKSNSKVIKNSVIIYADIDKFKFINDTYGHEAGDMVLEKYSQIISTKWPGRAYRIGGDEFILTAKRLSPGLSSLVSELKSFRVFVEGIEMCVDVSMGSLVIKEDNICLREALSQVDVRMYKDKIV